MYVNADMIFRSSCVNFMYFSKDYKIGIEHFTDFTEVHEINTRGSENQIRIDIHYTNIAYSTMKIRGAKLWNSTDANITTFKNIKSFRQQLKATILPFLED